MMDSQRAMGSLAPDATYVHLYVNGLYWGLYYPTERVMLGGEALYGVREDNDGSRGDDLRLQFSVQYRF